ncbi:MAG: DeoR/GlpR transcriptional regulator [Lachnospiraceae bacterium]|nr:DeoR/GlpR transcriptional regulator [Lachnospiraceae bacterium]
MYIEERHKAILDWLTEYGSISNVDIQEKFGVSYESAKRDLRILEEKGMLKRTHGGALPIRQVAMTRPSNQTIKDYGEIKKNYLLIARKAIEMIGDNDVIFLSSTTICLLVAQSLPENKRVRVVTNSIIIAEELRNKEHISVILLGGEMDNKGNCYDSFAISIVSKLRIDKSFVCAAAISADFGLSIQRSSAISFFNAVMDSSKKNIGLFPKEKIGFDSIVSICPAERLDVLITDWDAMEEDLNLFREKEIEVIVVEEE